MPKIKDGFSGQRAIVIPQSVIHSMEEAPLSAILHMTDIGYYPKAKHHFRKREEPISQYVFIYCMEGSGWYSINGVRHSIQPNQYVILPANQPHAYGSAEKEAWTIYWIHFKGSLASEFVNADPHPCELQPSVNSRLSNRIEMFEEIFHTLEMGYSDENIQYACAVFFHYLATLQYLQQYREATWKNNTQKEDAVTSSIHFMREHIEKKLSLKEIAEHAGYSSSHFSVLFVKRTGHAPLAYFNQLKIQQACRLLDFSDMQIKQICHKIGIEDPYYFSRLFRKVMGMSPMSYKKMTKG